MTTTTINAQKTIEDLMTESDAARVEYLMKPLKKPYQYKNIKDRFYKTVYNALDMPCLGMKRDIGGMWFPDCGFFDGTKTVCFNEELLDAMRSGKCLVYSFGLADDVSWELAMAEMGCRVRGFDPTVNIPEMNEQANNPNVTFHNIGKHFSI